MLFCLANEEKYKESESFISQAEKEYKEFFQVSDKHIDQAALQTIKGKVLMEKGDFTSAKGCFEKSLQIYSKVLMKNGWYDEQSTLYELMALLSKKMKRPDEGIKYLRMHKKQFGDKHPRTTKIKEILSQ